MEDVEDQQTKTNRSRAQLFCFRPPWPSSVHHLSILVGDKTALNGVVGLPGPSASRGTSIPASTNLTTLRRKRRRPLLLLLLLLPPSFLLPSSLQPSSSRSTSSGTPRFSFTASSPSSSKVRARSIPREYCSRKRVSRAQRQLFHFVPLLFSPPLP